MGPCTDFATALVCYDDGAGNFQTLIAHYEYGQSVVGSTLLRSIRYTQADGTVVDTSLGTVSAGACSILPVDRIIDHSALNLASGSFAASHDPNGNGASWTYAGTGRLQSVTVTALEAGSPASGNSVTVKQGTAGLAVFLVKGQTMTFSVAQDSSPVDELLEQSFFVEALGNSACTVAWTEEI